MHWKLRGALLEHLRTQRCPFVVVIPLRRCSCCSVCVNTCPFDTDEIYRNAQKTPLDGQLQQSDEQRAVEFAIKRSLFGNGHDRTHGCALTAYDATLTIQLPTLPQTRKVLRTRQDEDRIRRTRENAK